MTELTISASEITEALRKHVNDFDPSVAAEQVGRVVEVGDGIARVSGLPSAKVNELLEGKVDPVSLELARFTITGGRARDVVGTLDFLVDYVARARDWRVARVHAARALDDASQAELVRSLSALTGKDVELQIADQPDVLGGVLVEIGDLRLDATTRGRLGALREAVASRQLLESTLNRID